MTNNNTGNEVKPTDLREDFNKFIKKWTGNSYPHLIDNDENDGERFRQLLDSYLPKSSIKKVLEELHGGGNARRLLIQLLDE